MAVRTEILTQPVITTNGVELTTNVTEYIASIISGKKNKVGATCFELKDGNLNLVFSGNGAAKTDVTGCGLCGDETSCTKIKTLKGSYVGTYDCGCDNGQHYDYDFTCELPDEKEITRSPVWGTWKATLKSSTED